VTRLRLSASERSDMILDEALRLFAERHYSIVTVREIARSCDVNVGLIYYYFDSKEHLFRSALQAAIARILEGYESTRDRHTDPLATITAWLDVHATIAPMVTHLVKIMADYAVSTARDDTVDALIADFYERERILLERALRRGMAARLFRRVDAARTARFIGLHLDGIFHASASRGDNRIVADIAELQDMIARLVLA
jgi:TetR/AcrR family transcriptional regulator, cholesterol catabolism regulator